MRKYKNKQREDLDKALHFWTCTVFWCAIFTFVISFIKNVL